MTINYIIAGVVVLLLLLILLIVVGQKRKASRTISFEKTEEESTKELTQQEKSGNYQAKGGFNFAPAATPGTGPKKEPVFRDDQRLDHGAPTKEPIFEELAGQQPEALETEPEHPTVEPAPPETAETAKEPPVVEEPESPAGEVAPGAELSADVDPTITPESPAGEVAESERLPQPPESPAGPVGEPVDEPDIPASPGGLVPPEEATAETPADPERQPEPMVEPEPGVEPKPVVEPEAAAVDTEVVEPAEAAAPREEIAPVEGRLGKLRGRLSRSQNVIGQSVLGILSAGDLDEDAWEEIEDTLIMADLGTPATMAIVDTLREKIATRGVASEQEARALLRETLIEACKPELDRSIKAMPNEGKPAVVLVVGVNGTGKTTTTGKLARVLVALGHDVVLGAADTFRAAAADQLETWGSRVGATTVRGKEGADPASVAFDAVATGIDNGADVVLIDTAGRLHTSQGLMDQLGKVKRVVEKKTNVDEVLLVLDATVGQNGLIQARTFRDVVDITGVVLTKLDGTAKGGIVFQVQEELGVPVKLVGLGESADDLAPFEPESFVDALLG